MPVQGLKESIYSVITKDAAPIFVIAEKSKVSVQTASKYCYILQAEGRVQIQKFGNMNLIKRSGK